MAPRNRKKMANERRRKMRIYEAEPKLGSDDESELSLEDSCSSLDTHDIDRSNPLVAEAQVQQLQNTPDLIEIIVDSPISNADAQRRQIVHQNVKTFRKAALRGDWKAAETALSSDTNIARVEITEREDRALHMAAATKQTAFVRNLVGLLNKEDLELKNKHGYTAFCFAAASGVVEIAKVMYQKNNDLPTIRTTAGKTPLEMAVLLGRRKMVEYLYPITPLKEFDAKERMDILRATIDSDMYDIGLNILRADSSVVTSSPTETLKSALQALAQKPSSHNGTSQEWIWERVVRIVSYLPCFQMICGSFQKRRQAGQLVKEFWEQILTLGDLEISKLFYNTPILTEAVRTGNVEFLTLLTHSYPDLIWKVNEANHSIFHLAVINRQEKIFSLIYQTGVIADMMMIHKDKYGNNILHLAAKLPPHSRLNIVSGAALQMQRELLWFKKVEKVLRSSDVQMKNVDQKTPQVLFMEAHKDLQEAGEEWMKERATYCMVVATLIATIAFAAVFTVPGGSKQETGVPIFLQKGMFRVFVISDVAAMFSSTASIVMFLSILTSRYGEYDFLFLLPIKLMAALISLFASVVCMVSTFSATFFLVYKGENQGTSPKLFVAFAGLPIALYVLLNFRLWISLIHSTFLASGFMFKPGKYRLF